jgi:hypothetical protein
MSIRSTRRRAIGLVGLLGLAALAWWAAPSLMRSLVFTSAPAEQPSDGVTADVSTLQDQVEGATGSLGLGEEQRQERSEQPQQDDQGSWVAKLERWRLPAGAEPLALARRLEALVASADPTAEIYLVERETQEVQLRFYAGTRLAVVIELEPVLGAWPKLTQGQQPSLALVVHGIDSDPHGVRQLMEQGLPIALALSPYSPFSLRLSRDALLTHTEVLALAEPDVSLAEALEAVPHASGVLITGSFEGAPEAQARALQAEDVYVIDAVEGGLGAHWLRAFQDAGVPYLRASSTGDDPAARPRYRHLAVATGAAVVVCHAGSSQQEAEQLTLAAQRGYRLAFPAEVIEAQRR